MPRWSRSNPLALAVLVSLYEKPMHPYEVAQTLRQRAKQESVRLNYGSLYAVVESLEKKGFIKATGTVREGKRPERTVYADHRRRRPRDERLDDRAHLGAGQGVPGVPGRVVLPPVPASRRGPGRPAQPVRRLEDRSSSASAGAMKAAREAGLPRLFELEAEYEESQLAAELKYVERPRRADGRGQPRGAGACGSMFHTEGFNPEEVEFTFDFPEE